VLCLVGGTVVAELEREHIQEGELLRAISDLGAPTGRSPETQASA
jgi:hypothetical protein